MVATSGKQRPAVLGHELLVEVLGEFDVDRVRVGVPQLVQGEAAEVDGELEGERQLMLALASGAVVGRTVLGERAGEGDVRVGRGTRAEAFVKGPLCADVEGFSLHAGVRVEARDRRRLEHLCRYAGRPAIAASRLSLLPDGRVA